MEFRKITSEDKALLDAAIRRYGRPDCDLVFSNLISWGDSLPAEVCQTGGFIVIRYYDEEMGTAYTMPLGEGDPLPVLRLIEEDATSRGEPFRLCPLRDGDVALLRKNYPDFGFYYLRDRSEYVYLRLDLASLPGRKFQAKRNHVNKFNSLYTAEYSPLSPSDKAECLELTGRWRREKALSTRLSESFLAELDCELRSIVFCFDNFDRLGIVGGAIRVGGRVAAFCYGTELSDDTFCTHIEKADESYEGIFAVINKEFAAHLPEKYTFINREYDLGLAGLRSAKESYHPAFMLHKLIGARLRPVQLQVRRLWLECFPEDSPLDAEQFLATQFREEGMFGEWRGGELVSMLHVIPFGDTAYFYAVATDPRYRRQGLAGALISKALERCREQGFARAALIPDSEDLARWYSGMGFSGRYPVSFKTADCYDFGTGDPSRDLAMVLPLCASDPLNQE